MVELNMTKCNTSTRRPANVNWARKRKHAALRLPKMSLLKVGTTAMSYLRQNLTWSELGIIQSSLNCNGTSISGRVAKAT